jgi:hypothetical protein
MNVTEWMTMKSRANGRLEDEQLCLYWALDDHQEARDAAELLPTATCLLLARQALSEAEDADIRAAASDLRALLLAEVRRPAAPPAGLAVCKGLRATDRVTARGQLLLGDVADLADRRHTTQGSLLEP